MRHWLSRYFCSLCSLLLLALLILCIRDWSSGELWSADDVRLNGARPEVREYRLVVVHGLIEAYFERSHSVGQVLLGHPRFLRSGDSPSVLPPRTAEYQPHSLHLRYPPSTHYRAEFSDNHDILGFACHAGSGNIQGMLFNYRTVAMPLWVPAVLLLIPLSHHAYGVIRRRRACRRGLCHTCGYDLRASPGACPECGAYPTTRRQSSALARTTPPISALLSTVVLLMSAAWSFRYVATTFQSHWYPFNVTVDLIDAISDKDMIGARRAIQSGANIQCRPFCSPTGAMDLAIRHSENLEFVNLLLEHGFSLAGDKESYALLQLEDIHLLQLLLNCGASPNALSPDDPLLIGAVTNGNTEAVRLLLNAGADVNMKNGAGETALHQSLLEPNEAKDAAILSLLLASHPKLDVPDGLGDTPLHGAARLNAWARMRRLAEAGANIHIRNNEGKTALELIDDEERPKAAEILRKAALDRESKR